MAYTASITTATTASAATTAHPLRQQQQPLVVQVLGFYDRDNLGDESYKITMTALLRRHDLEVRISCTDDLPALPADTDIVVCGGGDIINDYFVPKILRLTRGRALPLYAVSVGLPYASAAERHLHVFDHVVVRSRTDEALAVRILGRPNVTYAPDLAFTLPQRVPSVWASIIPINTLRPNMRARRVVVCLARPVLLGDTGAVALEGIIDAITDAINQLAWPTIVTLMAFNTHDANTKEDDTLTNAAAQALLVARGIPCMVVPGTDVATARLHLSTADTVVCMRYHSLIFSVLERRPIFLMYTTQKVSNLAVDLNMHEDHMFRVPTDPATGRLTNGGALDVPGLTAALRGVFSSNQLGYNAAGVTSPEAVAAYDAAVGAVVVPRLRRRLTLAQIAAAPPVLPTGEIRDSELDTVHGVCLRGLMELLTRVVPGHALEGADPAQQAADVLAWYDQPLNSRASWVVDATRGAPLDTARLLCYVATGGLLNSGGVWGLSGKLAAQALDASGADWEAPPRQQVTWVWGEARARAAQLPTAAPQTLDAVQEGATDPEADAGTAISVASTCRVALDVDPNSQGADFSGYHRSGWAYATSGLRYLAVAGALGGRQSPAPIIFDSYLDRTFHWGRRTLEALDRLPYTRPWTGVVHHTFDETHSTYNCAQLLRTPSFIQSLPHCVAIFTLSDALRDRMQAELAALDLPHPAPPVFSVVHPTEAVPEASQFSLQRFCANTNRRIVQVGAWLRQPYAIYDLRLSPGAPVTGKAALRGKEMDMYFAPDPLPAATAEAGSPDAHPALRFMGAADGPFMCAVERLTTRLLEGDNCEHCGGMCRPEGGCGGGMCRPEGGCGGGMCRPEGNKVCRGEDDPMWNKFVQGLLTALRDRHRSVDVLQKLSNDEYDALLSQNIVLLKLVDASACNTVLECVVRRTPIIVNRIPALEQLLGWDYPGFYDHDAEADILASSMDAISAMHAHLKDIDLAQFALEHFVRTVDGCLATTVAPSA